MHTLLADLKDNVLYKKAKLLRMADHVDRSVSGPVISG
jgi:hypothetical protein